MQGKVEICGVNTARLKVLSQQEMDSLLLRAKDGDEQARQALIEGIQDGTIDMIATDHAPHSAEEKSKGLSGSSFGIVGLETAFAVLYTHLVEKNIISLERLVELLSTNPRKRFGIPMGNDFTVWDLHQEFTVEPEKFQSMGKATPFAGWNLKGVCKMTVCDGKLVYRD